MTSSRPYLLRGLYDWIVDNGMTPHILVDADAEDAAMPTELAKDGRIVFNLSASAVRGLQIGDDALTFDARFGGRARRVRIPARAVLAIYAAENGAGMTFDGGGPADGGAPPAAGKRPALKVVR